MSSTIVAIGMNKKLELDMETQDLFSQASFKELAKRAVQGQFSYYTIAKVVDSAGVLRIYDGIHWLAYDEEQKHEPTDLLSRRKITCVAYYALPLLKWHKKTINFLKETEFKTVKFEEWIPPKSSPLTEDEISLIEDFNYEIDGNLKLTQAKHLYVLGDKFQREGKVAQAAFCFYSAEKRGEPLAKESLHYLLNHEKPKLTQYMAGASGARQPPC